MKSLLLALGLFSFAAIPALAQSGSEAQLNAVAYKAVPAGSAVTVRPLDNSDTNMLLKKDFEQALGKDGFIIGTDAPFVLTFETRDVPGAYTSPPSQRWEDGKSPAVPNAADSASEPRLPFFDRPSGGLVNRGDETRDTSVITPTQHRIDVSLEARDSKERFWQAWAVANLGKTGRETVMRAMVPVIADAVGETVRQKPFPVP